MSSGRGQPGHHIVLGGKKKMLELDRTWTEGEKDSLGGMLSFECEKSLTGLCIYTWSPASVATRKKLVTESRPLEIQLPSPTSCLFSASRLRMWPCDVSDQLPCAPSAITSSQGWTAPFWSYEDKAASRGCFLQVFCHSNEESNSHSNALAYIGCYGETPWPKGRKCLFWPILPVSVVSTTVWKARHAIMIRKQAGCISSTHRKQKETEQEVGRVRLSTFKVHP